MSRQEFLDGLRTALNGEVAPSVIRDNLSYYEGYISDEMKKGRREEDVLGGLGDPRLIARTIIDTSGGGQSSYQQAGQQSGYYQEESGEASGNSDRGFRAEFNGNGWNMRYDKPKRPWFEKALIAVVIILAVFLVISMITGLISFLFPILVPLLIIYIIYRVIRGSSGR